MMLTVTYKSRDYSPDKVKSRYVRRSRRTDHLQYDYCEVGIDRRYDILQGQLDLADVPDYAVGRADALRGEVFGWVEVFESLL